MAKAIKRIQETLGIDSWRNECLIAALFFLLAVALQGAGGAYRSEFGGHPDEAAHYVTGLMIRDYLAAGLPESPMRYAQNYYDHYPKVALGNWPPVFYLVQSAWTLVFSPGRGSVLLLMAVLATMVALSVYHALVGEHGLYKAFAAGLLFIALPLVQQHTAMVMTEIPVTLFSFLAVLFFGRYLDRERAVDSLAFGLFASLAILTKGSGLSLALVPPLAVLFMRRFRLFTQGNFWYPALIVIVLCGPWTWKFRDVARAGWMEDNPSWHFTRQAIPYYVIKLGLAVGLLLTLLALIGVTAKLLGEHQPGRGRGKWFAAAAMVAGVLLFQWLVPCGLEPRHLIPALPAVIMFIFAGADEVVAWLRQREFSHRTAVGMTVGIALAGFSAETFTIPAKGAAGFGPAAERVLSDAANRQAVMLVSSDARGEGQFISEVAMRENRPGHIVRRASKTLASSTWGGGNYKARFENAEALIAQLEKESIAIVIVDMAVPKERRQLHHNLLEQAARDHPDRFRPLGKFSEERGSVAFADAIQVYRFVKPGDGGKTAVN